MGDIERRSVLTGLGAAFAAPLTVGVPRPAAAQDALGEIATLPDVPIQLFSNLFTRVGAAIMINGRGPFTFVIDTGAGTTSISDTVAAQLNLRPASPLLVHGITEARMTPSVAVERLLLSGLGFRNLTCPVFPREQLGADGLIGLDVLGRYRLRFDVQQRTASLSVRGLSITMGGDSHTGTRLRRDGLRSSKGRFGQMILTQVRADGQPTAAFIDSGAQYSIGNSALQRAVGARQTTSAIPPREVPIYGVTGESLSADLLRLDDLRLGPARLGATPLLFADLHCFETLQLADRPALLIGADLLGRFREVTLDFPAGSINFAGLRRQSLRPLEPSA